MNVNLDELPIRSLVAFAGFCASESLRFLRNSEDEPLVRRETYRVIAAAKSIASGDASADHGLGQAVEFLKGQGTKLNESALSAFHAGTAVEKTLESIAKYSPKSQEFSLGAIRIDRANDILQAAKGAAKAAIEAALMVNAGTAETIKGNIEVEIDRLRAKDIGVFPSLGRAG